MRRFVAAMQAFVVLACFAGCDLLDSGDENEEAVDWSQVVPPEYNLDPVTTENGELMYLTGGEDPLMPVGGEIPSTQYLKLLGKGWDIFGEYPGTKGTLDSVLDMNALTLAGEIEIQPIGSYDCFTVSGDQSSSFQEELGIKAGLQGQYKYFSGELKAAYGSKAVSTSNYQFASIQCLYQDAKCVIKSRFDPLDLSPYLTARFKEDLADPGKTPEKLFDQYGTHVLTGGIMGARYDYHFSAIKTNSSSTLTIGTYAEAGYKDKLKDSCKGNFSSDQSIVSTSDFSGASGRVKVIGGRAPSAGLNKVEFDTWNASIDTVNGTNLQLVGFEPHGLMKIWEFTEDATRRTALENAYPAWSESRYKLYYGNIPQKDAVVGLQVKLSDCGSAYRDGNLIYYRINQNLNEGTAGEKTYLYAAFGPDTDTSCQPITSVVVVCAAALEFYSQAAKVAKSNCAGNYTFINVDLNKGAGGSYMYLAYKRRTVPEDRPIRNLYTNNTSDKDKLAPDSHPKIDYPTVLDVSEMRNGRSTNGGIDLNQNAGGDYIYLKVCYDTD